MRNLCGVCRGYYIPDEQTTPCEHCLASGRLLDTENDDNDDSGWGDTPHPSSEGYDE